MLLHEWEVSYATRVRHVITDQISRDDRNNAAPYFLLIVRL